MRVDERYVSDGVEFKLGPILQEAVDGMAEIVQRRVDQAALDNAAGTLAEYGYVKVVFCRDCRFYENGGCWRYPEAVGKDPVGYCDEGEER